MTYRNKQSPRTRTAIQKDDSESPGEGGGSGGMHNKNNALRGSGEFGIQVAILID